MIIDQLLAHGQTPAGMIVVAIVALLAVSRFSPQVAGYLFKGLNYLKIVNPNGSVAVPATEVADPLDSLKKLLQAATSELENGNDDVATEILKVFVNKTAPVQLTKEDYQNESASQLLASAQAEMKAGHFDTANEIMKVLVTKTTVPVVGDTNAASPKT